MNFKDMSKEERKAFVRFLLGKFRVEQEENEVLFPGLKSASSAKSQFYDNGHGGTSKKINGLLTAFATLCDVEIPAEYKKAENGKTMLGDRFNMKKCCPTDGVVSPSIHAELVRWATDYVRERENSVVATLHAALKLASKPQLKFDVNTLKCIWLGVTITIQQNNDIKFSAIQSLANDFLKAVSNSPQACESEVNAARLAFVKSLRAEWEDVIRQKNIEAMRRCLSVQAKFAGQSLSEAEIDSFCKDAQPEKKRKTRTPFTKKGGGEKARSQ